MPTASGFLADPKLQDILEGDAATLIEAMKDFLMNSDRVQKASPAVSMDEEPASDPSGTGGN